MNHLLHSLMRHQLQAAFRPAFTAADLQGTGLAGGTDKSVDSSGHKKASRRRGDVKAKQKYPTVRHANGSTSTYTPEGATGAQTANSRTLAKVGVNRYGSSGAPTRPARNEKAIESAPTPKAKIDEPSRPALRTDTQVSEMGSGGSYNPDGLVHRNAGRFAPLGKMARDLGYSQINLDFPGETQEGLLDGDKLQLKQAGRLERIEVDFKNRVAGGESKENAFRWALKNNDASLANDHRGPTVGKRGVRASIRTTPKSGEPVIFTAHKYAEKPKEEWSMQAELTPENADALPGLNWSPGKGAFEELERAKQEGHSQVAVFYFGGEDTDYANQRRVYNGLAGLNELRRELGMNPWESSVTNGVMVGSEPYINMATAMNQRHLKGTYNRMAVIDLTGDVPVARISGFGNIKDARG